MKENNKSKFIAVLLSVIFCLMSNNAFSIETVSESDLELCKTEGLEVSKRLTTVSEELDKKNTQLDTELAVSRDKEGINRLIDEYNKLVEEHNRLAERYEMICGEASYGIRYTPFSKFEYDY